MRGLTLGKIAAVCGGEYRGEASGLEQEVSFITTDSREAGPGCLFAAIAGERSDGHDFIPQAAAAGAACALCQRPPEGGERAIVVPSTLEALKALAAFYRGEFSIPVVGIVGSVGKTTGKEMVSAVLGTHFCVLKTQGNFNNELGVPLTLFRLREEHTAAVVEMGISDFGEMTRLGKMVRPETVVFTAIGDSHLEQLGSREGILRAKSEILSEMAPDGTVFANGDDPLLRGMACPQRKLTFGLGPDCDIRAENVENLGLEGMRCTIVQGVRRIPVEIPAFGAHMVYAALEGAAVGMHYGLSDGEIAAGIAQYTPVGFRARAEDTGVITLINDCYNANPSSTAMAIQSQSVLGGRRVCILGDMLELGPDSPRLHFETGERAAKAGVDLLLGCGTLAKEICAGAQSAGGKTQALYFPDKASLIAALPALIQKGDRVLVKASRGMHFEDIVQALKALEAR